MAATTTEETIKALTPLQRARVAEELYDIVFVHVPVAEVRANASDDMRNGIAAGVEKRFADGQDEFVQQLLLAFARDAGTEPALLQAVAAVRESQTLNIRTLLTAGMLVNLTLLTATTTVEMKNDAQGHVSWAVEKKIATPELLKEVMLFVTGSARK